VLAEPVTLVDVGGINLNTWLRQGDQVNVNEYVGDNTLATLCWRSVDLDKCRDIQITFDSG